MRLYDVARIKRLEKRKAFLAAIQGREKRQAAAAKAVETKIDELREWVDSIKVTVPVMSNNDLIRAACDAYNDRQEDRYRYDDDGRYASPNSDTEFVDRICVNYLRHECSEYEYQLGQAFGTTGVSDARRDIREKVLTAIEDTYPHLHTACNNQRKRWHEQEMMETATWT